MNASKVIFAVTVTLIVLGLVAAFVLAGAHR